MKFFKEFKEFAVKGNVVDLAIAVIIGGAFGKIVTSLVNDIIMPLVGILVGGINFNAWNIVLKDAVDEETPAVTLNLGTFIQTTVDFIVIALCIFFLVKLLNKAKRTKEELPAAPPAPSKEETLLTEIRDLLKERK